MLKPILRIFTGIHVFLYRLSAGRFGSQMAGLRVLLLTTTGRKSGKKRVFPLGYFIDQDRYIIIASNGGLDYHPGWFLNLKANPETSIQVGDKLIQVTAHVLPEDERARLWDKLIQAAPLYDTYRTRTKRVIPLVALTPQIT